MKIGILTPHWAPDYGVALQAYALHQVINNLGHDVDFIDYQPYYQGLNQFKQLLAIATADINRYSLTRLLQLWKLKTFLAKYIPLSDQKPHTNLGLRTGFKCYDAVVCSGSVWDLTSRFDPAFFLDFVVDPAVRKISYAASFGRTTCLGNDQEQVRRLMIQFDSVSVRDTNTLRLTQMECEIPKAMRVLDPVFLGHYETIQVAPPITENYLLLYHQKKLTPKQEVFIRNLANTKHLIIVAIGFPQSIADYNRVGNSPGEWLGYLANAAYVVSDCFYGIAFSIIFRKTFTASGTSDSASLLYDLLKHFGLEERLCFNAQSTAEQSRQTSVIDYSFVEQLLDREIQKSKNFLAAAINEQVREFSASLRN